MAAKSTTQATEETSERKRLSIPKVDESVLEWWSHQNDAGLSIRLLIRAEIERNGMADTAYRPVTQQPRRGRPPGMGSESVESGDATGRDDLEGSSTGEHDHSSQSTIPAAVTAVRQPLHAVESSTPRETKPAAAESSFSLVDDLMNG